MYLVISLNHVLVLRQKGISFLLLEIGSRDLKNQWNDILIKDWSDKIIENEQ